MLIGAVLLIVLKIVSSMCVIGFDSQPYFVRIPLLFSAKLYKAGIAQLVEHHLAKVEVASSSLVSRSNYIKFP